MTIVIWFFLWQSNASELYDVVSFETQEKSGVSVQVLKTLWDHMSDSCSQNNVVKMNQKPQQQNILPNQQLPTLPPKTKNRKLTGTVSADPVSLSQVCYNKDAFI